MVKFYKGKYLISIYNYDDEIVDVFDNANEMYDNFRGIVTKDWVFKVLRMVERGQDCYFFGLSIHLIDVFDIQTDVFMEEDIEFLKCMMNEGKKCETNAEKRKKLKKVYEFSRV